MIMTREIAKLRVDDNAQSLRFLLIRAGKTLALCLVIVSAVCAIWILGFSQSGNAASRYTLLGAILILLAFWATTNFLAAIIRAFERPFTSRIPDAVVRPLGLLAIAACVLAFSTTATARDILLAHGAATIVSALCALVLVTGLLSRFAKSTAGKPMQPADPVSRRQWIISLFTISLVSGIGVINNRIDLIMVGAFSSLAEVAYYNVAMQLTAMVTISQIGVNAILAPKAARMFKTGDEATIGNLVSLTCLVTGVLGLLVVLALAIGGTHLLHYAFGPDFENAYLPMITMSAGALIAVASGPVALLLNMSGNERVTLVVTAVMVAAKVLLNLILVPSMGAQGAAISAAFMLVALNLTLTIMLWKKTGVPSGILLLWKVRTS